MSKVRLDVLLVERGLAESREKAQRMIRAGLVHTENELLDKPGRSVETDIVLTVKSEECRYVSRGGLKLEGALRSFQYNPADQVALDLGASTGGFTDCLLQQGAKLVYAIDVGRGQLHRKLELDSRVISREKTHIDELQAAQFDPLPELAVADLSFISLRRCFPVLRRLLPNGGHAILLVKPQFEAGRQEVPRSGVITDESVHHRVLEEVKQAAVENGLVVLGQCQSPILGGEGNKEFFLFVGNQP